MRPLIDIRPDDSVLDVIFECVMLVLFTLVGLFMVVALLSFAAYGLYQIVEGAVT